MGYFSNGAEGGCYEEQWCDNCQHQKRDSGGCRVWLAHLLHAYNECGEGSAGEEILNLLIPRAEPIGNAKCTMHLPIVKETP